MVIVIMRWEIENSRVIEKVIILFDKAFSQQNGFGKNSNKSNISFLVNLIDLIFCKNVMDIIHNNAYHNITAVG